MITKVETAEIVNMLNRLPDDKVVEVRDFVNFLHSRYPSDAVVDESDEWSDEDLRDFARSSRFAEESLA